MPEITFTPAEINEIHEWLDSGDFAPDGILWEKLYEYFVDEMPYGTAKARTGDPDVWIADKLDADGTLSLPMR